MMRIHDDTVGVVDSGTVLLNRRTNDWTEQSPAYEPIRHEAVQFDHLEASRQSNYVTDLSPLLLVDNADVVVDFVYLHE